MQQLGFPAISLTDVCAINEQLGEAWGIRLRSHLEYNRDIAALPDQASVERMFDVQEAAAEKIRSGVPKANLDLEMDYFRAIAEPGLHGIVTSRHRAWILDAITLTISTVRAKGIGGPILDVGCHVGHATSILAHHLPNPIVGIDPIREAIVFGLAHPARHSRVVLKHAKMPLFGGDRFGVILSVDSIPQKQKGFEEHIASYARNLDDGGIAIVVSSGWDMIDRTRLNRVMRKMKIGVDAAGVLGGFGGANEAEGNRFDSRLALILRKGSAEALPEDETFFEIATAGWDAFSVYANAPETSPAEKTQAFHWATTPSELGPEKTRSEKMRSFW